MRFDTLFFAALAVQIVSGATILENVQQIDSSTAALGQTVEQWKGNFIGTLPIIESSFSLLKDINTGAKDAEASAPLTLDEAFGVAEATIELSGTVNSTLQAVIDRKPEFDKLLLGPIILGNLKMQNSATEKFSSAIVEKVPEEAQAIAESLIADIEASFKRALDVYSLF